MSYRKFKADYLFDGYDLLNEENVLITKGDGTIEGIVHQRDAGEDAEKLKGILSPGLVNCALSSGIESSERTNSYENGPG